MKAVKFPSQGTIFDYYLDHKTKKFLPWADKVPKFAMDPEVPLQVGGWNIVIFKPHCANLSLFVSFFFSFSFILEQTFFACLTEKLLLI